MAECEQDSEEWWGGDEPDEWVLIGYLSEDKEAVKVDRLGRDGGERD